MQDETVAPTTSSNPFKVGDRVKDMGVRVGTVTAIYEGRPSYEADTGVTWDVPPGTTWDTAPDYGLHAEHSRRLSPASEQTR